MAASGCAARHTGAQRPGASASAERVARGGDQARRRRQARSAHAIDAERVARGGAPAGMLAQPAHAGRLMPASPTLKRVSSPGPDRLFRRRWSPVFLPVPSADRTRLR